MFKFQKFAKGAGIVLLVAAGSRMMAAAADERKELETFNQKFLEVTLRMDNAGLIGLWAEDGVTLLPGTAPIEGRATIAKWLDDIVAKMRGYKVTKQVNDFHDIQISGDWASEWGTTYQIVQPPDGKPVIETYGKILLVLHKDKDGAWKIKEEMWNGGVRP